MPRLLALSIAFNLLCFPALAAPVAHRVDIVGESVRLRDLLSPEAQPKASDPDLDRVLLTGLRPGEQRVLTPAEIHLRLADLGLDPEAHPSLWSRAVAVTRRAQVVPAADLIAAAERAIHDRLDLFPGDEAAVTVVTAPPPMLAPIGDLHLEAAVTSPRLPGGLWIAHVVCRSSDDVCFDRTIRFRVRVTGEVLVARRRLRRHETLAPTDVALETREIADLRGRPLRSLGHLAGYRAARSAVPGAVVSTDWLEPIPAVARGQLITVEASVGAVRASARVTALANGKVGDLIAVRADRRAKEFLVRVSAPGRGEVIPSQ